MEKKLLGTVVSDEAGPSTNAFSMVISGSGVRRGMFVCLESDRENDVLLIGAVSEVVRGNRYFERPESVAEYDKSQEGFSNSFPVKDWDYAVANCVLLGVFSGSGFQKTTFPPQPGAGVFEVESQVLEKFLGFKENGLFLGELSLHPVKVKIGLTDLLQKHLAILAMSGAGKSVLSCVIIEELLDRPANAGRLGCIVFDVHGEYSAFSQDPAYSGKTKVVDCEKATISARHLTARFLEHLVPDVTLAALRVFEKISHGMAAGEESYDLNDLMKKVDEDESLNEKTKASLSSALYSASRLSLFGKVDFPSPREISVPGGLCVFDFSKTISNKKRQAIVFYFLEKLFDLRRKGEAAPFLALVEEAHNFAKEGSSKGEGMAKGVIEKIAREGRKFGACLCLVSQRPKRLSVTALSQCNSLIIMRMTNPNDLKHVGESCEAIDSASLGRITTLNVGEGIILGEAGPVPFFARFRNKKVKGKSKGLPLEELASRFEEENKNKRATKEDAQAFI